MKTTQSGRTNNLCGIGIDTLVFLFLGILSVILFHLNIYYHIAVSVVLMGLVVIYFVYKFIKGYLGIMMALLLLVYLLPFIHIPPYLWFDFNSSPQFLWGLRVNPYMTDKMIIELTAMLGAVGAIGIAFGVSFIKRKLNQKMLNKSVDTIDTARTLNTSLWLIWVMVGLLLSWISAPQETIFVAAYTLSKSLHDSWNFSSAWIMSYIILTFAFCDMLLDRNPNRKAFKRMIIIAVTAFVVIYLQLLRGDRESVPWVFALAIVYYYFDNSRYNREKKNTYVHWFKLAVLAFLLVFISMIIGSIRSILTGKDLIKAIDIITEIFTSDEFSLTNILSGTWSAVLLTPLSVAGDYINNLMSFKWGQDYLNIVLSLLPGFVADAFGYQRPLDALRGPAWEMTYGLGGTHAVVLPFRNFGMLGVFLIPSIWSYFLARCEGFAFSRISVINLSLLATVIMASPHWLWYGEKNIINAFIIWLIMIFFYRVSLSLGHLAAKSHPSHAHNFQEHAH